MTINEKLNFKTNTLLKNLVGKDLINDDNIAIIELVKNSYDADSKNVLVKFTDFLSAGVSTKTSQMIIADEGTGMDIIDIKDKWLNIAYSEKVFIKQGKGSHLAGNKGIGRFSCDRLGQQLDLLTRKIGNDLIHLRIWWPDFEEEGKKDLTIQDIELEVKSISEKKAESISGISVFPKSGTILVISSLRSFWYIDKLRDLKNSLEKFINPNQLFDRNPFLIDLSVPDILENDSKKDDREKINGIIKNQIFEKLSFNSTYIDSTIISENNSIKTILFHDGEKVFELEERNKAYPLLEDAHVVIYYLNPYKKAYFKRQTGVRSVDFGSIFLFLNGFRIAPYGNRSDDWLGLDVRKTQGTQRNLGSRDIVGRIEITGNEEKFKPISSREGLKNTDAFIQLREDYFLDILRKLERFVVDGLQWDSVPKPLREELRDNKGLNWESTLEQYSETWEKKKQRIVLSILTLIGTSQNEVIKFWFNPSLLEGVYQNRQTEVKKLLEEIEQYQPGQIDTSLIQNLSKIRKYITEKENETELAKNVSSELRIELATKDEKIVHLEGVQDTYRAQTLFFQHISTLDVKNLLSFHHQINLDATIANNYLMQAIKSLREIPNTKHVLDNLEKASLANKRISVVAQYATKANFRSGVKKEPTDIPAFFEQYLVNVAKDFIAAGIMLEVDNQIKEPFEINASRIELSILIDNIISNSSKAHAHKMVIRIIKLSENNLRISFIDDGIGLSKELPSIDSMFELGITTTAGGSGFGLYHAKNIVEKIFGKIYAIPLKPNGMEIRVELTK